MLRCLPTIRAIFDGLTPSGREPERMARQINADKIKLIPAPAAGAKAGAATSSASAAAAAATASALAATREAAPPTRVACTEIGNFTAAEAKRFEQRLASLALGERQSRNNVQEVASRMVYIAPQGDKEGADKKAGELRRLGVTDFFVIQDNSNLRWGISLGVFKSEEAAKSQLANLSKLGVHSARISTRSVTTGKLSYRLRDLDQATRDSVEQIKADFPNQELRGCS
ncbi:SPOR domain-containing protein [Undibacterium arcticum]